MTITCRLISETVAKAYGVTVLDLNSRRKGNDILMPRRMSWYLARNLTSRSLPEIGRFMGGRDHSTIIHGLTKMESEIREHPDVAANYEQLVDAITVLGEVSDKVDEVAIRFDDIDPRETAESLLEAKFRDMIPSMEAVRSLCMGVQHYASELEEAKATIAELTADIAIKGETESELQDRLSNLMLGRAKNESILDAAATVVIRLKALRAAEHTIGERPARKALEASLTTLQTIFERN